MSAAYDPKLLSDGIDRFTSCRILVVGDVILDEYLLGRVDRISPEAPVPVVEVVDDDRRLGGAGNVVSNIIALGGQALLFGVIGDDPMGGEVVSKLGQLNSDAIGIVVEDWRPTTIKTRVWAHSQQVVRVDREKREPVSDASIEKILATLKKHLDHCDAIVVVDYGKGVVTQRLMDGLRSLRQNSRIILAVDPTARNVKYYTDVTLITPNNYEAQQMSGIQIDDDQSLTRAGTHLLEELGCQVVLITQGDKGMTLFENDGQPTHIPTVARKVFDVSGAGDTVIATFTLALAAGLKPGQAAELANLAAGIVVGEVGTAIVPAAKLKEVLADSKLLQV
jgi:rfaE bifunctional protein kinase chain/domain